MTAPDTSPLPPLHARDPRGHKGTFGTVAVVGGCARPETPMIGAPVLSALGALRAGCGLARLVMPAPILPHALTILPPATGIALETDEQGLIVPSDQSLAPLQHADALVVGPGLGADRPRSFPVADLTSRCIALGTPCVLDADALNALVAGERLHRLDLSRCILTPHPGEFARLAKVRGIGGDPTDTAQRPAAAADLARSLGCVVVLKGAGTVVSDGSRAWVCTRGHPCMGTAGTGDVLAGLIASLIAQHHASGMSLYDCARLGVEAHARAGELWATDRGADAGMLAPELAGLLPGVLAELTAGAASPNPQA